MFCPAILTLKIFSSSDNVDSGGNKGVYLVNDMLMAVGSYGGHPVESDATLFNGFVSHDDLGACAPPIAASIHPFSQHFLKFSVRTKAFD